MMPSEPTATAQPTEAREPLENPGSAKAGVAFFILVFVLLGLWILLDLLKNLWRS